MSNNAQKLNFGKTLGQAARQKTLDHIHLTGKSLPASIVKMKGSIATVKFETGGAFTLPQITIPMMGPEWSRNPMQPGDKGVVMASDTNTSSMSGLGPNNPPSFTRPGNLSPLHFMPIGNANWKAVDPNKQVSYGPNGAQMADSSFKSFVGADKDGGTLVGSTPTGTPDPTNIQPSDYEHTVSTDDATGVTAKSSKKVKLDAPTTQMTGNATVAGALGAATAAFGAMTGAGGTPATLAAGVQLSGVGGPSGDNTALAIDYQHVTPVTGATVTLLQAKPVCLVDPAGALAALTLAFPACDDGTVLWVAFTQGVTTVTLSAPFGVTFANHANLTTVPESSQYRFCFLYSASLSQWFRI